MVLNAVLLLATLQQGAPQQAAPAAQAPSPIARLEVLPGTSLQMPAGDTLRLSARALDANGQPVPDATIRYFGAGGRFEGTVDSTVLIRSGSTGTSMMRPATRGTICTT